MSQAPVRLLNSGCDAPFKVRFAVEQLRRSLPWACRSLPWACRRVALLCCTNSTEPVEVWA